MTVLSKFFVPPVFEEEIKTRKAYLLNVILWGLVLVPIPYVLYHLIAAPEYLTRALIQAVFGEIINGILLYLLRREHVHAASILQVTLFWLFFTASALTSDGVRGAAYLLGYPLVIVIAGILLGGRATMLVTLFSLAAGGIMAYSEMQGQLTIQMSRDPFSVWAISLAIFPMSAALQYLAAREIWNSLLRARASEEKYRQISQVSSDYTFSTELDSTGKMHLNWVAGAFKEITGYTYEEYVSKGGWLAHLYPEDAEKDALALARLKTNQPVIHDIRTYTKAREVQWVRVYAHPVWDQEKNKLAGIVGAVQDITNQYAAEERELRRRAMLEKVVQLGKFVTEIKDLRTTLERIWQGVRDELGFDRVGIFLYNPQRHSMDGTLGTDNLGQMVESWDRSYPLSGIAIFTRLLEKPNGMYFTHDYTADNGNGEDGDMVGVKDYAAAAAWAGEKPVAILCVDNVITGRPIEDEELEALRLFSGYAGLAIQNVRLNLELQGELEEQRRQEEREARRRAILEKVVQLGKGVTQVNDLRTTLEKIWHGVHDDLGFDRLAIFLYDLETHSVRGTLGTDDRGNIVEEWDYKRYLSEGKDTSFARTLEKPDGVYYTHNFSAEHNIPEGHEMYTVKDFAAVAAWAGDKPVAIITVDNAPSGREISEEQLEALRLFGGYAGLAIENARLNDTLQNELDEQKQQEEREARRRVMVEKVAQLGKVVTEVKDLRTTLTRIWHGVHDVLGFDRLAIFLYNHEHSAFEGTLGTNSQGQMVEEWDQRYPSSEITIFNHLLEQPDGYYFTHNYEVEHEIEIDNDMYGVKDYAAVAAWVGEKPIAVICVDNLITGRPIRDEELEALRLFGGYAGLAIENARLNSALQTELVQRQSFIDELESKNAELERFTYTVSHDLKSPLVTITGFLGFLEKDALSGDQFKVKKTVERITTAAQKMQSLLNDLLELSRVGRIMNLPEHVPCEEIVREAVERVRGRLDAKHAQIKIQEDLPVVYGDRIRLVEVLQNLIDNAAKYADPQSPLCIEIGTRSTDGSSTIFFVHDNGIGINPQFHERIFGLFNKLDPLTEGTGIGLTLVKRIIEVHGGQIWVESELGQGATFYFTLPNMPNK